MHGDGDHEYHSTIIIPRGYPSNEINARMIMEVPSITGIETVHFQLKLEGRGW